ncbi:MAG: D-aminoacylase [Fretibacterium sp.]|nr:D-aminoacylase [Fretibacterium sp.]
MKNFDRILRNGRICDGTGNPSFHGDIGISGDRIEAVGRLDAAQAAEIVDISGLVVSPGFIDLHNHVDHGILAYPDADSYIMQGVTTSVVGNCGLSMAPVSAAYREDVRGYLKPFLDKKAPYSWDWSNLSEFFSCVTKSGITQNLAPLVGQGTLRIAVKGFDPTPATDDEMNAMKELLRAELENGAFGMSSGLVYPPGSYTGAEELRELARIVASYGALYSTHIRNEADRVIKSVDEAIALGEAGGVSVQVSHHKAAGRGNWGKVHATLRIMEEARARGVDVTCDVYPYIAGMTTITSLLPSRALEGGTAKMLARLKDPEVRKGLAEELHQGSIGEENWIKTLGWDNIVIAESGIAPQYAGMSLARIISERGGSDPFETFLDWFLEIRGEATMILSEMDEADVRTVIAHPLSAVISDSWVTAPSAGGRPHPRAYGTFPRLLGKYVREEKVLSLEEGVRKITSMPARKAGIRGRGLIAEGFFADLVVFDPETIRDKATFLDPHQYPEGIRHVLVNGQVVVTNNTLLGVRPGKILRK